MKRILGLIVCSMLFWAFSVSAGSAERLFQTYHFQFSLLEGWLCSEANDSHIKCLREKDGMVYETIEVFEPRFARWQDDPDVLSDMLERQFECSEVASWEAIKLENIETVFVHDTNYNGREAYISAYGSGKRVFYVQYIAEQGLGNKDEFLRVLSSVSERPASEMGFYVFGDADVKFEQFRTKEIAGKKRLLLDFTWRNIGTSISTFDSNMLVMVFQDGIELHESITLPGATETDTRIMPGKELDCIKIFDLKNPTGEITVIMDKLMDEDDNYLDRQFTFNVTR